MLQLKHLGLPLYLRRLSPPCAHPHGLRDFIFNSFLYALIVRRDFLSVRAMYTSVLPLRTSACILRLVDESG